MFGPVAEVFSSIDSTGCTHALPDREELFERCCTVNGGLIRADVAANLVTRVAVCGGESDVLLRGFICARVVGTKALDNIVLR